ncbi:GLPGLI family protein [uncultured Psychroserpens sp.]|uniref:GLPGLI family protein n=1 Tax=uncultured Psychroserpens sp. TaxID=255436 RepID=UPI00262265FC|nr:GLPGLI family protein [uncultured Psychroserpens sp.]
MKTVITNYTILILALLLSVNLSNAQDFQGKAYYASKTTMDMSRFTGGRQMTEQQKKDMKERMRKWLERTYILTFNKEESMYKEDEVLEGPGGRGPSMWGSSFSPGPQYKNVKTKTFIQDQEFFGKKFLIKEEMQPIEWVMGTETKQIGKYTCFKATATRVSTEINWSRRRGRGNSEAEKPKDSTKTEVTNTENKTTKENSEAPEMVEIVAWYTPMIPINQGPADFWGLPGLILEVSAGNTTILCSKIIMNPEEKTEIDVPTKGEVVTKKEYNEIITEKMQQMRDSRGRSRGRR